MNNLSNYSIIQMPPSFTMQIYNTYFISPNFFALFFIFFLYLGWYFFGVVLLCMGDSTLHPHGASPIWGFTPVLRYAQTVMWRKVVPETPFRTPFGLRPLELNHIGDIQSNHYLQVLSLPYPRHSWGRCLKSNTIY